LRAKSRGATSICDPPLCAWGARRAT